MLPARSRAAAAPGPALDELEPARVLGDFEHDLLAGARHLRGVLRYEGLLQGELDAIAGHGLDIDRADDVVDDEGPLAADGCEREAPGHGLGLLESGHRRWDGS